MLSDASGVLTEVTGSAGAAGRLTLSGSMAYAGPGDCPGGYRVDEMTIDSTGGRAGGHYKIITDSGDPDCVPAHVMTSANITAFTRMSHETAPASLVGEWRGYMREQDCWVVPANGCKAMGGFNWEGFTFSGSDAELTGTLPPYGMLVTGRVEGNTVRLASDYAKTTQGRHTFRMLSSSVTRDDFGRLTGSFAFHREAFVGSMLTSSYDVTVDLWRVALVQR